MVSASSNVPFIIVLDRWDLEGACSEVTGFFLSHSMLVSFRNVFGDFYMSCGWVLTTLDPKKNSPNGSIQSYTSTGIRG